LGKALAVKVAEVQNMARHVLRKALVLWLSGQHLNRPCKSGEATKATGKQKWPTLRNVGIRYSPRERRDASRGLARSGHGPESSYASFRHKQTCRDVK
jgi:hypothetical protein